MSLTDYVYYYLQIVFLLYQSFISNLSSSSHIANDREDHKTVDYLRNYSQKFHID